GVTMDHRTRAWYRYGLMAERTDHPRNQHGALVHHEVKAHLGHLHHAPVVVAPHQDFAPPQLSENGHEVLKGAHAAIAHPEHRLVIAHMGVVVVDERLVHLLYGFEGTLGIRDDVEVVEVGVRVEMVDDHGLALSFKSFSS